MELQNKVQALQEVRQIPATQTVRLAGDLSDRLLNEARSPADVALSNTIRSAPDLLEDPRIMGIIDPMDNCPFAEKLPVPELIFLICLQGTASDRAALCKNLKLSAVFTQMGMKDLQEFKGIQGFEKAKNYISNIITGLCNFFGVGVTPALDELAETIYDTYGGLSCLDLIFFADRVRKGKYRNDIQNIATRGVNAEFLMDWIKKYMDEREDVFLILTQDAHASAKAANPSTEGVEIPDSIKQEKARIMDLEFQAGQIRMEFEKSITRQVSRQHWTKQVQVEVPYIDDKGNTATRIELQEVMCAYNDKDRYMPHTIHYREDVKGGAYKRLILFLGNFAVHYGPDGIVGENAWQKAKNITAIWEKTYKEANRVVSFEDYARAECNALVVKCMAILEKWGANFILRTAMGKKEGKPGHLFVRIAGETVDTISQKWPEYLKGAIEGGKIPMKKSEYLIAGAINICHTNNLESPVDALIESVLNHRLNKTEVTFEGKEYAVHE